jgi:DNA-binding LacI/PurR family transcriptional regulator
VSTAATRSPKSRPSMSDVGRLANVSAQTVSRYFTGAGYVRNETRERIEAAIAELGYRPNLVARNLRANRTHTVGVISMDALNHGNAMTLTGLSRAARKADYSLITTQLDINLDDEDAETAVKRALDQFISARVDGIVIATSFVGTEKLLDHIWEQLPVITISGRPWANIDSATVDSHHAGLIGTRHLVELGHRRILHLAGPLNRNEAFERQRGYFDALDEAGVPRLEVHSSPNWSAKSGYDAGLAVDPSTFTAVFAGNDQIALGFMRAMSERGLVSPDDYSIVGVDDMPDARYWRPSLTSVWMDFVSVGQFTFERLHRRITTGEHEERLVLEPTLVARESSRAI